MRNGSPQRSQSATARMPQVLLWPAWIAVAFFALPLIGLLWHTPWSRFGDLVFGGEIVSAFWLSILCSVSAAIVCLLIGLPLAVWLAEGRSRARVIVRVLVTLPMVLPPVVGGVAMLLAFGRRGLIGGPLDEWFGIGLPFTSAGVILAEAYVAMPFFVLTVEGGLRALDRRYGAVAATLGASPAHVFRTVTLPLIAPSLRAGLLVAWARALGEFGATITFAGNLTGETRTLPLAVYVAFETDREAAIVLSLILVAISAVVLFALRRQWFPVGRQL